MTVKQHKKALAALSLLIDVKWSRPAVMNWALRMLAEEIEIYEKVRWPTLSAPKNRRKKK